MLIEDVKVKVNVNDVYTGKSCVFSVLKNIFQMQYYKESEIELFILCNGMQLFYEREKYSIELDLKNCINNLKYYDIDVRYISKNDGMETLQKKFDDFFSRGYIALLEINPKILKYQKLYENSLSEKHSILAYASNGNWVKLIDTHMVSDEKGGLSVYSGEIPYSEIKKGLNQAFFLNLANYNSMNSADFLDLLWKKNISSFLKYTPLKTYIEDLNIRLESEKDFGRLCSRIVFDNRFFSFIYVLNYIKEYIDKKPVFYNLIEDTVRLEQNINLANYIFLKAGLLKKAELYIKAMETLTCSYNMLMKLLRKMFDMMENI